MTKYIDADKLIAEIERKMKCWEGLPKGIDSPYCTLKGIRKYVDFLQQEQLTDVDLEKEIDRWFDEKYMQNMEGLPIKPIVQIIARHFWNKGYNARREEAK